MNARERNLAIVLLGLIFLIGGGVVAYLFVLSPIWEKDKQIAQKKEEVLNAELDIDRILAEKKKYELSRVQSLPADVKISRGQYAALLEGLIRRADYPAGFKVSVLDADSRSSPTLAPKKPAYTKLSYDLTLKGDLYYLLDFLKHFYEQPLLHTIKKINIQKTTESRARGKNDLDVAISIEAVVLDNADDRPTLLPVYRDLSVVVGATANVGLMHNAVATGKGSPIVPVDNLVSERDYLSPAGKNIFFGPPAKKELVSEEKPPDRDVAPFVIFVACVGEDGVLTATLRDILNNQEYEVTQRADGKIVVESLYTLNERKRSFRPRGNEIVTGTTEGRNVRRWVVRKVGTSELILEYFDPEAAPKNPPTGVVWGGFASVLSPAEGKMTKLVISQRLDKGTPLLTREAWTEIFKPGIFSEPVQAAIDAGR